MAQHREPTVLDSRMFRPASISRASRVKNAAMAGAFAFGIGTADDNFAAAQVERNFAAGIH